MMQDSTMNKLKLKYEYFNELLNGLKDAIYRLSDDTRLVKNEVNQRLLPLISKSVKTIGTFNDTSWRKVSKQLKEWKDLQEGQIYELDKQVGANNGAIISARSQWRKIKASLD